MQGGLVARKVSVRLSVHQTKCDKTEERSVQIFIPYKRSLSLVFWEEWLVGNYGSTGTCWNEITEKLVASQP